MKVRIKLDIGSLKITYNYTSLVLRSDNYVIDWNVYELDEETDETHNAETNSCGNRNLLEFCKK